MPVMILHVQQNQSQNLLQQGSDGIFIRRFKSDRRFDMVLFVTELVKRPRPEVLS